jgi:hypothetical protein
VTWCGVSSRIITLPQGITCGTTRVVNDREFNRLASKLPKEWLPYHDESKNTAVRSFELLSMPGYSLDGLRALVYFAGPCGPTCGTEMLALLRRRHKEWVWVRTITLAISRAIRDDGRSGNSADESSAPENLDLPGAVIRHFRFGSLCRALHNALLRRGGPGHEGKGTGPSRGAGDPAAPLPASRCAPCVPLTMRILSRHRQRKRTGPARFFRIIARPA